MTYNNSIELYENVKQNENFYIGKQWEGVNAPDLEKPVNNILKRIVSYFIAMIVSDDITARVEPLPGDIEEFGADFTKYINDEMVVLLERTKAKPLCREAVRDAAVDGDACAHVYWDMHGYSRSSAAKGAIAIERIDNTNIVFGNPADDDVQNQPYIIIAYRRDADEINQELEERGVLGDTPVMPDAYTDQQPNTQYLSDDNSATVYLRYWRDKDSGKIKGARCTASRWLQEEFDTDLTLYPIAWWTWERVKNSYHGHAAITGLIPNQIMINKLQAMLAKSIKDLAFPKIVYDATKIDKWTNRIGEAIGVFGNPNDAVARVIQGAAVTTQVQQLINDLIALTKDTMGASDAALGNINNPDNTSAIIAVQQAASAPLELQKQAYYQWVEDMVRVCIDMMVAKYGKREMAATDPATGDEYTAVVDFSKLTGVLDRINVHVGASAYWSELAQIQTADNLLQGGIIDNLTYLEMIPDAYIRNKGRVMQQAAKMQMMQQQQQMMQQMQQAGISLHDPAQTLMAQSDNLPGGNQ